MKDEDIQKYIEKNMFNEDGSPMCDVQTFYEGAKWMRDFFAKSLNNQKQQYEFEKYKVGYVLMGDRTLLKEYWEGCIRPINDLKKINHFKKS
jgi:hypothetical protein